MPPKLTDDQIVSEIVLQNEMIVDDEEKDERAQFVIDDDEGWAKP
jgi:hypothetical protein